MSPKGNSTPPLSLQNKRHFFAFFDKAKREASKERETRVIGLCSSNCWYFFQTIYFHYRRQLCKHNLEKKDFFALLPLRLGIEQNSGWEIDFFSRVRTLVTQSRFSAFSFSNVSLKWHQILSIHYFCFNPLSTNRSFSPDVTAAILVYKTMKTAAMLVYR